jgi:hypothetical protein
MEVQGAFLGDALGSHVSHETWEIANFHPCRSDAAAFGEPLAQSHPESPHAFADYAKAWESKNVHKLNVALLK